MFRGVKVEELDIVHVEDRYPERTHDPEAS